MIVYLDRPTPEFADACGLHPVIGAEIATQLAVYGTGLREVGFWFLGREDGRISAVICRDWGRVRIAAGETADPEELAAFLKAVGWKQIQSTAGLCCKLLPLVGGVMTTTPVMCYPGGLSGRDHGGITDAPPLPMVYDLNQAGGPPPPREAKNRWYAFASHLVRHDLGLVAGILEQEELVCTGGVYAWGRDTGVIASLATDPRRQGAGYGARMVRYLCDRILERGKTPVLVCANDGLAGYYGGLGFTAPSGGRWGDGRWAEITKRGLA